MSLILVAGCVGVASPPAAVATTFIQAEAVEPGVIDPHQVSRNGVFYTFECLTLLNLENSSLSPCLAKSWEAIDAKNWKFTLNPGIKFSNGDPLTSADVQYSFYRTMGKFNPQFPGFRKAIYQDMIDTIDTPDANTVIFRLKRPEVSMPDAVRTAYIAPKNYIEKVGDEVFGKAPIGTGPYMFKERKVGEFITLEANPNYWNTKPIVGQLKPPTVKTVIWRYLPEEMSRIAALQAGDVDAVQGINPDNAKVLEKDPKIKIYYASQNMPVYTLMNWRAEKDPDGNPNPFLDVRVRQAMNYALDLDAIIKNWGTGREYRTTMLGKGGLGYNPNVIIYNYNPDKARQLLKEAGYPNGFTTKWFMPQAQPIFEAMQKYWKDVGIDTKFTIQATPVSITQVQGKTLGGIIQWSAASGSDPMLALLDNVARYDGINALHGKDPVIEDIVAKAKAEIDPQKRAQLYDQAVQIFWRDAWFVPLWEPTTIFAVNDKWDYSNPRQVAYTGLDITSVTPKK